MVWQKKIFTMHQDYRGMDKIDAEKYYVSIAEKQSNFRLSKYKTLPCDCLNICLSRDGMVLTDKNTNAVMEMYAFNVSLISWTNNSFQLEMSCKDSSGSEKVLFF